MKVLILGLLICMTMGCSFRDGAATSTAFVGTMIDSTIGSHGTYENNKKFWDKKFEKKKPAPESKRVIMGVAD